MPLPHVRVLLSFGWIEGIRTILENVCIVESHWAGFRQMRLSSNDQGNKSKAYK
ncbi:hypothetical protein SLEP1_g13278 [Rubroshorea leprosula]|uniref:Uncharacterized protein n=1 Tax=Rubroshorea leprosula TaxID=152421 RepID=A0AAV5ILA5_9ROSI|nr:hypothetical protein SLEP1_g13278 [Rubroshorea leprosula]